MTYYNLSNLSQSAALYDQIKVVNNASDGMLVFGILLSLFFILFLAQKLRYDFKVCFASSMFITTLVSILFLVAELTSPYVVISCVVLSGAGAVMLVVEGG